MIQDLSGNCQTPRELYEYITKKHTADDRWLTVKFIVFGAALFVAVSGGSFWRFAAWWAAVLALSILVQSVEMTVRKWFLQRFLLRNLMKQ